MRLIVAKKLMFSLRNAADFRQNEQKKNGASRRRRHGLSAERCGVRGLKRDRGVVHQQIQPPVALLESGSERLDGLLGAQVLKRLSTTPRKWSRSSISRPETRHLAAPKARRQELVIAAQLAGRLLRQQLVSTGQHHMEARLLGSISTRLT